MRRMIKRSRRSIRTGRSTGTGGGSLLWPSRRNMPLCRQKHTGGRKKHTGAGEGGRKEQDEEEEVEDLTFSQSTSDVCVPNDIDQMPSYSSDSYKQRSRVRCPNGDPKNDAKVFGIKQMYYY